MQNRKKIYFSLVSLASVVGLTITISIALYTFLSFQFISDDEYIKGSYGYNYSSNMCLYDGVNPNQLLTGEAKATCVIREKNNQKEQQQQSIDHRIYSMKETLIGCIARGFVCMILALLHIPTVLRKETLS